MLKLAVRCEVKDNSAHNANTNCNAFGFIYAVRYFAYCIFYYSFFPVFSRRYRNAAM